MSGIFEETENQHRIPQEKLPHNRMHCTHFLALRESLPASMAFTHLVSTQSTWAHGWVAGSEQSSCHPSSVLSRSPRLFHHQPRKKCCTFCSTSSAAAHHQESGISAEQIEHVFLHGLPSGKHQKCIVACTCLSKTINSVNWTDPSNNIH